MKVSTGSKLPPSIRRIPSSPRPQSTPNVVTISKPVAANRAPSAVEKDSSRVGKKRGIFRRFFGGVFRRFRGFLDWYRRANERHPYLTGVATASSVYVVGDTVAQCIMPGKQVDLGLTNIATLVGISLYYGWESPLIFRVIDRAFPLEEDAPAEEDRSEHLVEGAAVMTGQSDEGGALRRLARFIGRGIVRRKQKFIRAAAYRIPIAPFWTMRHMGVLALIHGSTATPWGIVGGSLAVWATWLPLLFAEEYVVQNKIPLEYRFLAVSAGNLVWQISASLVALLGC